MIICPNLNNPDVAREFEELRNATTSDAAAYRIWSLNNGNHIDRAPNGAPSILFKTLLNYYKGDRTKAIQAKAKVYSNSFLEWFGDWTELATYVAYQGRKLKEIDNRRYNYWSINKNEAEKNYGPYIRSVRINPTGFLFKNIRKVHKNHNGENVEDWTWSEEYNLLQLEFREKYGYKYGFDILDNSEEGLKKLNLFFEFLESKGYKGYSEYDQRKYQLDENPYTVTFGNNGVSEVSKVVDENGEPLVVWHGTTGKAFDEFLEEKIRNGGGFWFTSTKELAYYDGAKIPAYLNMKRPFSEVAAFNAKYGEDAFDDIFNYYRKYDLYISELQNYQLNYEYDESLKMPEYPERPNYPQEAFDEIYDILYGYDLFLTGTTGDPAYYRSRDFRVLMADLFGIDGEISDDYFVVTNPNQIKSIENKGTFSKESNKIYHNIDFNSVVNESRIIKRNIRNGFVLSDKTSDVFNRYVKTAKGKLPKSFYIEELGIVLIKSNNYKNSRRYHIVSSKTGEILEENIPVYTKEEHDSIKKSGNGKWNPEEYNYSEKKSFAFKSQLVRGGKSSFKRAAKLFIMNAIRANERIEYGENTFNLKIIDLFVDGFTDDFWEQIFSYTGVFSDQIEQDDQAFGVTTTSKSVFDLIFKRISMIPKQGLIKLLSKNLNIKFNKKEFINRNLKRKTLLDHLRFLYYSQHPESHLSKRDAIDLYCETVGADKSFILNVFDDYDTYDGMYWADFRYKIENFSPFDAELYKITEQYELNFLKYLLQGLSKVGRDITIGFNLSQYDLFNVIVTVFHEPFHALDILTLGTEENIQLYSSITDLLNTKIGKLFVDKYLQLGGNPTTLSNEIPAVLFSIIMSPKDIRLEFVKDNFDSCKNLTQLISTFVYDVQTMSDTKTVNVESTAHAKNIGYETVYKKRSLTFLLKLYNFIAKGLSNILPFLLKFLPVINEITESYTYEVVANEIVLRQREIKDTKSISINDFFVRQEFINALDEVIYSIKSLADVYKSDVVTESEVSQNIEHQNELSYNNGLVGENNSTEYEYELMEQVDSELDDYIKGQLDPNMSTKQAAETIDKATEEFVQSKQRQIMGETLLQLAKAFGLTQQEDGSWSTNDNSVTAKLRVDFVNSMDNPGSIDFDADSMNAHATIQIGLDKADASTFNHELAHYYIRTFWNSKEIQDALDMVYVKEMGDYKNDPKARIAVEEALTDYLTQRTIDSSFLTNIESNSFYQRFWEAFNKMLYRVFDIKTETARNAILNQTTRAFIVNLKLDTSRKKTKYAMHKGTMYLTTMRQRKLMSDRMTIYQQLDREQFETTVGKIVKAIQSKAKSYSLHSRDQQNSVYGDEQQMAFNQESVRIVKESVRTIEELQEAGRDVEVLEEKVKLFDKFLDRADEEIDRVLRIFENARANDMFKRLMFNVDSHGVKHYDDASNDPITPASATAATQEREFTWDDLVYAKNDIVGFFGDVIEQIKQIAGKAVEYGIDSDEANALLDKIINTGLSERIRRVEALYNEARRIKVKEWINQTVDERVDLDDEFKQRLKINMLKWMDEQQDFGDISSIELWAGMGSMSKSPIIRAFLDEISRMQTERDEQVRQKGLAIYNQLQKAKKQMGLIYRILPFNVQKLLMLLDRHGLPTGNLLSKYNDGQYRKDLEDYKNKILFGKNGVEEQVKRLRDSAGNPVVSSDWKLMVDEHGEPILPDNPLCEPIEKEYMKLVEVFKSDKVIRRFTPEYYMHRINSLSVTTLRALNRIQADIERILKAVTINGKLRIDLLTIDQQLQLHDLYNQRDLLGSIINIDGSYKVPGTEEYKIACELREFRLSTWGKIIYSTDWVAYNEAYNNSSDKKEFRRMFSRFVVNPEIWKALTARSAGYPEYDPDVMRLKLLKYDRAKLIAPFKEESEIGYFKWDELFDQSTGKIKNEGFFYTLRDLDELISQLQDLLYERYKDYGPKRKKMERDVLIKYDIPANLVPGVTNWMTSESQHSYMLRKIKEAIDADPSLTPLEKALKIVIYESMLSYHDAREDVETDLSMFSIYLPADQNVTEIDGVKYASFIKMPKQMFQKPAGGEYVDPRYDETQTGLQLTDKYLDKRYTKYIESGKHDELEKLLNDVRDLIKEGWDMMPFLSNYDNRAAQIGARTGQILGRKWYNPKRLFKNIGHFLKREWEVVESDTEFLPESEYETRPDGTRIQNIPVRFIKRLDQPEYLSSDIVGSAIKFYEMALNYKIKAKNASRLASIVTELSKQSNITSVQARGSKSLAEALEGIMGRLVYEDKNSISNNREKIFEHEWKHLDWIRKYIISSPASWIKRLGKSRAAFQLGMLGLNFTSGIISFLDPLISLCVDSITGKYINYRDVGYALYKMSPLQANIYGNLYSLGSVRNHNKLSAAMDKFALSKRVQDQFDSLDRGSIMRFLSDGLIMKHFTLGDYTINSINLIATMHNYRYYKKQDGTAGFYPKHVFMKVVMDDLNCGLREAKRQYKKAVNMWSSCSVDENGDFVASNNEYGNAISAKEWNEVKAQVRSRSSIYNGIVSDLEKTYMQTNIYLSFVTMLRNFFITGIWERFQSYNDFLVASLDQFGNPVDRPSTLEEIKRAEKELNYYKGGYSFATRQIENGVDKGAVGFIKNIGPYLKFALFMITHSGARSKYGDFHKDYMKHHNLSQTDIYGIQKVFMEFCVVCLLLIASSFTNKIAEDNEDNYWAQMLNLITLRLTIERATWMVPSTPMDLISSPTAALSDWRRKMKLFDLLYDATGLSDHDLHEEVKRGRYIGAERWKYNLFNGLSSFGLNNWYADTPEELGGGGAKSVSEKANFYRGLVRKLPFGETAVPKEQSGRKSGSKSKSKKKYSYK